MSAMKANGLLFCALVLSSGCDRDSSPVSIDSAVVADSAVVVEADTNAGRSVVTGFSSPESVLHDPVADVYLVSNVSGSPLEQDHDGFVSKVTPDGQIVSLRFIDGKTVTDGLSAPKGMAIVGRTLFVADIDRVRTYDADSGAPKDVIMVPGAAFLNDVTAGPDGVVYVTDTGLRSLDPAAPPTNEDAVVALDKGQVRRLASGSALGAPNGIVVRGSNLEIVTLGSAEWLTIDASGAVVTRTKLPGAMLDGLVLLGDGRMLASSWETKSIYSMAPDRTVTVALNEIEAPADIGYDAKRHRLLVPQMTLNQLLVVSL